MVVDSDALEKQRQEWRSTAKGWRKWDSFLMTWLKPVGEKIIGLANLNEGDVVLDVGTGSGEPGLSAARRVGKGRVVGLDISEEMVQIAREKARSSVIENYEARVYSSSEIPFGSNYFDAVVSRFGVMFFPDVLAGLKEMVRVLRHRGTMCVSVWGPQNKWAKAVMGVLTKELALPDSPPDSPNPFRCSESGKIVLLLRQAGLSEVGQAEVMTRRTYGSSETYWDYLMDMNASMADSFSKLDVERRKVAKQEVMEALEPLRSESGQVSLEGIAWVAYGDK